jgi:hypothetical protein
VNIPAPEFLRLLDLPADPRDLLTPQQRATLDQDLQAMALRRRQVEAQARDLPLASPAQAAE